MNFREFSDADLVALSGDDFAMKPSRCFFVVTKDWKGLWGGG